MFLDVQMPGVSGFDVVRRVSRRPAAADRLRDRVRSLCGARLRDRRGRLPAEAVRPASASSARWSASASACQGAPRPRPDDLAAPESSKSGARRTVSARKGGGFTYRFTPTID